jgi:hypothetical protein
MSRHQKTFDEHQHARFMRPDAGRWLRPDAERWLRPDIARFLKPGFFVEDALPGLQRTEMKYSPDQPRDDRGRWTDGGGSDRPVAEAEGDATDGLVQDILVKAEQLKLTGSLADYRKCVDLCYPILERFSPRWSDRNYWDFQRCMNACLGLNR